MNKALLLFTMKRFLNWVNVLMGGSLLIFGSCAVGTMLLVDSSVTNELLRTVMFGPFLPILIAYSIISPQVANSQRRKDGEYLSLIFSRPVSRCTYVMTKWLSGSLLTMAIMTMATAIALGVAAAFGHYPQHLLDGYAIADAVLNSLSYTALVVLISSFPYMWGVAVMIVVMYSSLLLSLTVGSLTFLSTITLSGAFQPVIGMAKAFLSTLTVGVDTYHIMNSSVFPLTDFIVYVSNIVLYLTLAVLVMSMREFFYAND
jgi:hypothetical protein